MILLVLALAALLQVAPSAWGPIENGPDGMNAAIARELALGAQPADIAQLWGQPVHATVVQRITAQSFRLFNVNELAARLPFALANWIVVGLVFLAAERMGGFWRGLASGIICATMNGPILHGRDGSGMALTALLLTIAIYALIRMLEQRSEIRWQTLFWLALAGLLALGQPAAVLPAIIAGWSAFAFFREARIRLRPAYWVVGNLALAAGVVVFFGDQSLAPIQWRLENLGVFFRTLFPWSIIILPAFVLRLRKILRLNELTPSEAAIWIWFVSTALWILGFGVTGEWSANVACLTPVFALLASLIWERANSGMRIAGVALLVVLGFGGLGFCSQFVDDEWISLLQPIWWLSSSVIICFGMAAVVALHLRHSRAALLIIAASTVPMTYNLLDARARYDWQHSLKDFGKKVEVGYMPGTEIYLGREIEEVSSFLFYAPPGLRIQAMPPGVPGPKDYLLVCREELAHWSGAEKIGTTHSMSLLRMLAK